VRAQQQQPPPPPQGTNPTQPTAPIQPIGSSDKKQPGSNDGPVAPVQGPNQVVTGGLAPSVGNTSEQVSQIRFGFQAGELFDTNFAGVPTPSGISDITNFGGHLELHRLGPSSHLFVRYEGGGFIDAQNSSLNAAYHEMEASELIQFRRWSLHLDDLFSYLPDSSFGFMGIGGLNVLGVTVLNPNIAQNQTILTTHSTRIGNSLLGQVQVDLNARSALTFTGSYEILKFKTAGLLNPTNYVFDAGYNYELNRRDTLGVSLAFNAFRFTPAIASINDTLIQVTYGHHISNRLSVHVGGGPEIDTFTIPSSSTGLSRTLFGASAGVDYQLEHTNFSASFTRGVSGGAGILSGAQANTIQVSVGRRLGRNTEISGSAGYSLNDSLPQASAISTSYQSMYFNAGFKRQFGRDANIFVDYSLLHQTTNAACANLPGCGAIFTRHQILVGFAFDFKPVALR
jgi:hypothetical protein